MGCVVGVVLAEWAAGCWVGVGGYFVEVGAQDR